MAVVTGTATDYKDLLEDLKTALEANSWVTEKEETIDGENIKYFSGPNVPVGAQNVNAYINVRTHSNATTGYYNWEIRGATTFDTNVTYENQPGTNANDSFASGADTVYRIPTLTLSNSTLTYWFMINDRRFIVVVKVETRYINGYFGFILPYGTPTEFPYPLLIAGSAGETDTNNAVGDFTVGACYDPPQYAAWLRDFNGSWVNVVNYTGTSSKTMTSSLANTVNMWPYCYSALLQYSHAGDTPSPTYPIFPVVLCNLEEPQLYGELEGVFYLPGTDAAPEDTITISAEVYLVTQKSHHSQREDYAVIKQV